MDGVNDVRPFVRLQQPKSTQAVECKNVSNNKLLFNLWQVAYVEQLNLQRQLKN